MARSVFLVAFLLAACGGGSYDAERPAGSPGAPVTAEQGVVEPARQPGDPLASPDQDTAADTERRLIRRATLRLRVDGYAEARAEVAALAGRFDAYIGGEQERRYPGRIENTLTLRVEADRFEPMMEALLEVGREVDFRTIEVEDVTRQFVDLEARLGARRAVAERLTALLQRANTVEEILAVQTRLAEVLEEIEAAEGQLRFLRNQVALSTITVTLFEESATGVAAGSPFLRRIADAFTVGWQGVQELAIAVVALWPLWVLAALLVPIYRRLRRRHLRRKTAV